RVHLAVIDDFDIARDALHAVARRAAQIGPDKHLRDLRCVVFRKAARDEDIGGEFREIFGGEGGGVGQRASSRKNLFSQVRMISITRGFSSLNMKWSTSGMR